MKTGRKGPAVAIVGAGFGGLGMAASLLRAGFEDVVIFERAGDVGGVWRDNTYPGAACDVPSHLYSLSFAPKHDWSRRFAPQPEILAYLRDVASRFGLLPRIRFGTEVTAARFDQDAGTWTVELAGGGAEVFDVLIAATGQLSRPARPAIAGLDTFAGRIFHSATWDHDYDLTGRNVAVIGTGASAIQLVPQVRDRAARLLLFQRHPAHVLPKADYPYPEAASRLFAKIPVLQRISRMLTYLQLEPRAIAFTRFPVLMALPRLRFAWNLRRQVKDPAMRRRLTPGDPIGCQRILLANDYYSALNQPDVELVTEPILRVGPEGPHTADGAVHEVDAIILATGFRATDFLAPMRVTGRDGLELNEVWRDGAQAYLGIAVSGFPNLFLLYGPNTNLGHTSIVYMLESQFRYVTQAVRHLAKGDVKWLDVRPGVESAFNDAVQERIRATVWDRGCTSWYRTAQGRNTNNWPGFTFVYRRRTARLRPSDFRLEPASR